MSDESTTPYGRPRRGLPESGTTRLQVTLPVGVAQRLYDQSNAERRPISSIVGQALTEFNQRHPAQSWGRIE